jgi:hypothetical protein
MTKEDWTKRLNEDWKRMTRDGKRIKEDWKKRLIERQRKRRRDSERSWTSRGQFYGGWSRKSEDDR